MARAAPTIALVSAGALPRGSLYVDCNPMSPGTLARLAERLGQSGCSLVDACILGGSPRPGAPPSETAAVTAVLDRFFGRTGAAAPEPLRP